MMKPSLAALLAILPLLPLASANTEKIIFTAPPPPSPSPLNITTSPHALLADLNIIPLLAPSAPHLRTRLARVFHPDPAEGPAAWFLLGDLVDGRRYELRVCWSALEPTAFTLDVYSPSAVSQSSSLLRSLSDYASSSSSPSASNDKTIEMHQLDASVPGHEKTTMLLRVQARADYFSHLPSLMTSPPPVLVDLVLDPYIYNIAPHSLLPTAAYLLGLAVVAWFLARWIASSLVSIAGPDSHEKKKQS